MARLSEELLHTVRLLDAANLVLAEKDQAYRTLMGKAIEFAQYLDTAFWPGNNAVEKAQEFLTSPEVQAWREQREVEHAE